MKQKTTTDKLATWVTKLGRHCNRITARDAGPDDPPLLDVPVSEYEREAVINELSEALDAAQECAGRAITVTLIAWDAENNARNRLVVRLQGTTASEMPVIEANGGTSVDMVKVLLSHNQAITAQMIQSCAAITNTLQSVMATFATHLQESERKRVEAMAVAADAIEVAQEAATKPKSAMDRVGEIVVERMLGGGLGGGPDGGGPH